ncbi:hypothetical protein [Metapseudomonas otitidis]|uniref:hypothetical protein n=1 Tax=Metapseudomonas otitidis TaxID=319939 RepID=UPI0008E7AE96|nr:hypothetical protein [Pseudomonas otitidis]SFA45317.1 hypothetical protein SAMN05216263_102292 [Pseudomonas otitidis]
MIRRLDRTLLRGVPLVALALLASAGLVAWQRQPHLPATGCFKVQGEAVLADGRVMPITHTSMLHDGRFYSTIKQDRTGVLVVAGRVEVDWLGAIEVKVEHGGVAGDTHGVDGQLAYTLLRHTQPGARVHVLPVAGCFYGIETHRVICPYRVDSPTPPPMTSVEGLAGP